jgi:hypothetical protein
MELLTKAKHGDSELTFGAKEITSKIQMADKIIHEQPPDKEIKDKEASLTNITIEMGFAGAVLAAGMFHEFLDKIPPKTRTKVYEGISTVMENSMNYIKTHDPKCPHLPYFERMLSFHKSSKV